MQSCIIVIQATFPPTPPPKQATNMCKTASPAANRSLRRLDGWGVVTPHSEGEREGEGYSAQRTLDTSGDVGRNIEATVHKESRYSAGAGEHLWETILGTKNGNDCKLEMHFYSIVYQHEYSAWRLQAILISPMNNRARNWEIKCENWIMLYAKELKM